MMVGRNRNAATIEKAKGRTMRALFHRGLRVGFILMRRSELASATNIVTVA